MADLTDCHVLINNKDIMFVYCCHFGKNYSDPVFGAILLLTEDQSGRKVSYEYVCHHIKNWKELLLNILAQK
jgi:hypothetical protein